MVILALAGPVPWALASAHVILPFPLSSHIVRASTFGAGADVAGVAGIVVPGRRDHLG